MRLMTEQEVVVRALKIAELAYSVFELQGLSAEVPPWDSLQEEEQETVGFK